MLQSCLKDESLFQPNNVLTLYTKYSCTLPDQFQSADDGEAKKETHASLCSLSVRSSSFGHEQ